MIRYIVLILIIVIIFLLIINLIYTRFLSKIYSFSAKFNTNKKKEENEILYKDEDIIVLKGESKEKNAKENDE